MKKLILVLLLFLGAANILYYALSFQNKVFTPSDIKQWRNAAEVGIAYQKNNPDVHDVLWNPNMFGGMPNYAINYSGKVFFLDYVLRSLLQFQSYPSYLSFLYALMLFSLVYFFVQRFDIACLIGVIGIFTPGYVSLFESGHNAKAASAIFFAGLLWAFIKAIYERKWYWGLLFSLFLGFAFRAAHPQMVYYALLSLSISGIYYLFSKKMNHSPLDKAKVSSYFLGGILLALGLYALSFFPIREYMHETIRGGGGLNTSAGASGLSHDYANAWSFHPLELLTLLNPSYFGLFDKTSILNLYWGWMVFTSTSFYIGVMMIPLAVLGMIRNMKKPLVILLILAGSMSLIIAFGKHNFIPFLNELMLQYIPYYSKFRAPSVAMFYVQVILLVFAGMGLKAILTESEKVKKLFFIISLSTIGLLVFSLLFQSGFSFTKVGEAERYGQNLSRLIDLRQNLFSESTFLSIIFLLVLLGTVFAFLNKKISPLTLILILGASTTFDLYRLDKPYFKNIIPASNWNQKFGQKYDTDVFLLSDSSQYRVLPIGNLFGDTHWSFYHQNLGGYSPAKLTRYQTFIEQANLESIPKINLISMMNAKYLLFQPQNQNQLDAVTRQFSTMGLKFSHLDKTRGIVTYENTHVLPRLWLPDSVLSSCDTKKQFKEIKKPTFDPKKVAYISSKRTIEKQPDSIKVHLKKYTVHEQIYDVQLEKEGFVAIGEVYYPAGWTAFVNGKETPIIETNYLIRGLFLPQGEYTVSFVFSPKTYRTSKTISSISAWIYYTLLLLLLYTKRHEIILFFRPQKKVKEGK